MPTENDASNLFDEGFELDHKDESIEEPQDTSEAIDIDSSTDEETGTRQSYDEEQVAESGNLVETDEHTSEIPRHYGRSETKPTHVEKRETSSKPLAEIPEHIVDEFASLKRLNPEAAELALEDSPEGASIRVRLEQYGAEIAQDRAEHVLYQRQQIQAQREAEEARLARERAEHNAAFESILTRDHPDYTAMLKDPNRRIEAAQYQKRIFNWIAGKPYSEAAHLMDVAKYGRDPNQVSALLSRFKLECGQRKNTRPDPTGALAVPGRGAPVAPSGIGDKDDFDAGWNANPTK